jgi:hypothetical protein
MGVQLATGCQRQWTRCRGMTRCDCPHGRKPMIRAIPVSALFVRMIPSG